MSTRPGKSGTPSHTAPVVRKVSDWLSNVLAVTAHEWRLLVFSPLTLTFQISFLLALSICIFLVADFYSTDIATVGLQWTFLPWVALVLTPALAMRAFSENAGDRSLELTLSLPVPVSAVVTGKWLAGTGVLLTTLAMTAPFALTVGYLGSPDWGVVFSGYLGAALLLTSFYAVALAAASLSRDQVTAFVCGLAALFAFVLIGWDLTARLWEGTTAGHLLALLSDLSPKRWLDRMAEGRIEFAAIAYFVTVCAAALVAATYAIERRRHASARTWQMRTRNYALAALAFAGALIVIGLTTKLPGVVDTTAEREFTLHKETSDIIAATPDGLRVDFYYSADETSIPAGIRAHARRTRNLLEEFASLSRGNIELHIHRVAADTEAEEAALTSGVRRIPMTSGDSFLLGATMRLGDRQTAVSYFDERRSQLLEYDLALAISTLSRKSIPKVGLLSPLLKATNITEPRAGLSLLEELKRQYDIAIIPHFSSELPGDLDALVVIDAPILKSKMLYAIDQHVMSGRGLIAMLDAYPRFNRANAQLKPEPGDDINDISDLLARYGAAYDGGNVVGDPAMAAPVYRQDGSPLNYPFWLRVKSDALSRSHPSTASLQELLFAEAGRYTLGADNDNAVALVTTGADSGQLPRDEFKSGQSEEIAAKFKPDGSGPKVVAAALAGPFDSAFSEAPKDAQETTHIPRTPSGSIFAIADADWIFDPMALQDVSVGERTVSRPLNDNITFLLNMIEYATGDARLIGIRSRGRVTRPFTTVSNMLAAAQEKYRAQEADFVTRISGVESTIAKVLQTTGAKSAEQLPDEIRNQIIELRKGLLPFRRQLREVRRKIRQDVENLGHRLTLINLATGPLIALALSAILWRLRRRSWS